MPNIFPPPFFHLSKSHYLSHSRNVFFPGRSLTVVDQLYLETCPKFIHLSLCIVTSQSPATFSLHLKDLKSLLHELPASTYPVHPFFTKRIMQPFFTVSWLGIKSEFPTTCDDNSQILALTQALSTFLTSIPRRSLLLIMLLLSHQLL